MHSDVYILIKNNYWKIHNYTFINLTLFQNMQNLSILFINGSPLKMVKNYFLIKQNVQSNRFLLPQKLALYVFSQKNINAELPKIWLKIISNYWKKIIFNYLNFPNIYCNSKLQMLKTAWYYNLGYNFS